MIYDSYDDLDRNSKYDGYSRSDDEHAKQRNFFIRTYNTFEEVYRVLANEYGSQIKHFHIIQHNKDDVKGTHSHLVLVTDGPTSVSAVHKWFSTMTDDKGRYGNTFVEIPKNITYCYQYLVHANNTEKEPYTIANIKHFGNATPCINAIKQVPEFDPVYQAWEDYKNGASASFMIHKYGRDYLYHVTQFEKAKSHMEIDKAHSAIYYELKCQYDKLFDIFVELSQYVILRRTYDDDGYVYYSPDSFYDIVKSIQRVADSSDNDILNNFDFYQILKGE